MVLSHREEFLPGAIASVLSQTLERDRRQLLVTHWSEGYHGKFNEVAAAARGEFLVPLCDDDRLGPEFLASCLAVADRATGADIIFTDRRMRLECEDPDATRQQLGLTADDVWRELRDYDVLPETAPGVPGYYRLRLEPSLFDCGSTLPMTCMIRTSFWRELGGYDDAVPHMDTEFWARAAHASAMVHYIPQPLWEYRKHGNADVLPYLRAYNRKHFRQHGQAWEHAVEARPGHWVVPQIAEHEREQYIRDHYPELAVETAEVVG